MTLNAVQPCTLSSIQTGINQILAILKNQDLRKIQEDKLGDQAKQFDKAYPGAHANTQAQAHAALQRRLGGGLLRLLADTCASQSAHVAHRSLSLWLPTPRATDTPAAPGSYQSWLAVELCVGTKGTPTPCVLSAVVVS